MLRKYLKTSNIIFIVILGVLLYAPARARVQSWILSALGSPTTEENSVSLSPSQLDYTFYNLEGDSFNLLNFKGKPIFLNFWATWCGPCKAEMPSIIELVKKHKGSGEIFLLSHEEPQVLKNYLEKEGLALPIYYSKTIPKFVTSESIPLTYLIDKNGSIIIEKSGAADWSDAHILELLE